MTPPRRRLWRRALAAALVVCAAAPGLAGCAGARPGTAGAPPDSLGRAPDGLLARADLQALVDAQVRRSAGPLVEALNAADPATRARAALALGSVESGVAADALTRALQDPEPAVRADAAFALGQTADSTAAPFLFLALRQEGTAAVQREIVDAIGKIGSETDGDALLRIALPAAREADRALALARLAMRGRLSPAAFGALAGRLRSADAALRERAAYAFSRAGGWGEQAEPVRDALDALASGDAARMHLARALGRLEDPADASRLARALASDPDWRVRTNAAAALRPLAGAPEARGALVAALDDISVHVRVTAAGVLASQEALPGAYLDRFEAFVTPPDTADWHAQAALLPALARAGRTAPAYAWLDAQTDPFAAAGGLTALGAADDDEALARLVEASGAGDTRLAGAAVRALGARWRRAPEAALAAEIAPALLAALRRLDPATTPEAAGVLADSLFRPYEGAGAIREAYAALPAGETEIRTALVNALGQVRGEGEIDFLIDIALGDAPPALKRAAVRALNDRLTEGIGVDLTQEAADEAPPTTAVDWTFLARLGPAPRLVLQTTRGEVVIEMDPEAAPQTVQAIARTAREGLYNGVPFHRVVPNFVVQGGDYFRRDGSGGPEVAIRSEFSRLRYARGVVGMASSGKDTEGVQFFVTHSAQPHLDGRYTAFGRVVEGMDVIDALRVGDRIVSARVPPDLSQL